MKKSGILLHLPALSVIFLPSPAICASPDLQWPYNLPPHEKYYPEHEGLMRRNDDVLQRLQKEVPTVVRKMGSDPSEMFFLDYWSFGDDDRNVDHWDNSSLPQTLNPALPLHATNTSPRPRLFERYLRLPVQATNLFSKRDFMCPTGTFACTSINRPNACCPSSSTCQIVSDTGLGDVGCCEATEICAGSLSQCASGYTSCPNSPGGGCCLPGFQCFEEGCVQTSTTIVIATPAPTSSSSILPTVPVTVVQTTTVVVTPSTAPAIPSTVTLTTTVIVTPSVSTTSANPTTVISTETITTSPTSASQSPSSANSLVCSSGYRSCPVSLGGGCCPTDRACASDVCPALTSSGTLEPPVRGTSSDSSSTSSLTVSGCPGGYYACSAYHPGGCCQVGRDCSSTSCPAGTGFTVLNTGSITIVAPSGPSATQNPLTGACATGWSTCGSDVGGGCCPAGFVCGTAACTATVSGQAATQGKIAPNGADRLVMSTCLAGVYSIAMFFFLLQMIF